MSSLSVFPWGISMNSMWKLIILSAKQIDLAGASGRDPASWSLARTRRVTIQCHKWLHYRDRWTPRFVIMTVLVQKLDGLRVPTDKGAMHFDSWMMLRKFSTSYPRIARTWCVFKYASTLCVWCSDKRDYRVWTHYHSCTKVLLFEYYLVTIKFMHAGTRQYHWCFHHRRKNYHDVDIKKPFWGCRTWGGGWMTTRIYTGAQGWLVMGPKTLKISISDMPLNNTWRAWTNAVSQVFGKSSPPGQEDVYVWEVSRHSCFHRVTHSGTH